MCNGPTTTSPFDQQVRYLQLHAAGVLSTRTLLELSGVVKDVDDEMERLHRERDVRR